MPYLKTNQIGVNDETVTITQLSGLDRFDYLEYCTTLPKPEPLEQVSDDAPESEKVAYVEQLNKNFNLWQKSSFTAQARLAAYGCKEFGTDIEQRHQFVMLNFSMEQVKMLHDEVAILSGIPLPVETESEEVEQEEGEVEQADPKS